MTTLLPPSVEKLRLAHLTRNEAQARTALAQRVRVLPIDWNDQIWQLTLVPMADSGPVEAQAGEWRVQVEWAGAPFDMVLPGGAAQAWIAARFPALDVNSLPDELTAAALDTACYQLLAMLSGLGRGAARILGLERKTGAGDDFPHVFRLEARCDGQVLSGRLGCGSLGLMLMAGLAARLPALSNELPVDDLPVLLRAEIGHTWLDATELSGLLPGDAVLVEHAFLSPEGELWLGHDAWGVRVQCDDTELTVTQEFIHLGLIMSPTTTDSAESEHPISPDKLPLRLAFDLGERTMTLAELQNLQVGQAIDLARPLSSAVSLRVNGALVGTGELVEIDGRLGVTITALATRVET
ncbi:MAG: type III secretion system cytoplasmic ring protein SctQ [Ramlibacter sp.]